MNSLLPARAVTDASVSDEIRKQFHPDARFYEDTTHGAALLVHGPEVFEHTLALVVPEQPGGQDCRVVHFDRRRLLECSGFVRCLSDFCQESAAPVPSMLALPIRAAHASTVGALLNLLVPPAKLGPVTPPEAADLVALADYLDLDEPHSNVVREAQRQSLKALTAHNCVETLARATAETLSETVAAVADLVSTRSEALARLADVSREDLQHLLTSPHLALHEDTVWKALESWCHCNLGAARPPARTFREQGLHQLVQWHALSPATFDHLSGLGYLFPKEHDEIVQLRTLRTGNEADRITYEVMGATHEPRRAPALPADARSRLLQGETLELLDLRLLQRPFSLQFKSDSRGAWGGTYSLDYSEAGGELRLREVRSSGVTADRAAPQARVTQGEAVWTLGSRPIKLAPHEPLSVSIPPWGQVARLSKILRAVRNSKVVRKLRGY